MTHGSRTHATIGRNGDISERVWHIWHTRRAAMVIVHLYRQVSTLSKETRDIIAKYADESARAQAQLLAAIQRSDDVIERNTEALRRIATLDQNMSR